MHSYRLMMDYRAQIFLYVLFNSNLMLYWLCRQRFRGMEFAVGPVRAKERSRPSILGFAKSANLKIRPCAVRTEKSPS